MSEPFKRPESVLVVVYNEHHQVLVLQRIDDPSFWQSVTGSMEHDETPIQTALRELKEETGIDLHGTQALQDCRRVNQYTIREDWRHRYAPGITRNFEYVFCAQVSSHLKVSLTEHLDYVWLTKQAAIQKVWSKSNKEAIQQFIPELPCK
ncbi:dihydroneopterin triphosphate diphosphatase [Glaciecola sp. 2405UD65-10]|uniref:dihydroneopterin triphosphate diphosphatase n=1 Tax=Glaciecola sp. 2405UD65-10 TaxID=3397244 RepID=UPI003B5990DF